MAKPAAGPGSDKAKKVAKGFRPSGPGRPAPIKKQPLPAYGPYKLPLTDTEKRIVISKRTPKFVDTPRGRLATGGGGVGFFTKGSESTIMDRVRNRALARDDAMRERERLRGTGTEIRRRPEPLAARKPEQKKDDGGLFDGLTDFYDKAVAPAVGAAFFEIYDAAKNTGGQVFMPGGVALAAARKTPIGDEVDAAFDFGFNVAKSAGGIVKDKGWEPAKKTIAPALDSAYSFAGDAGDVAEKAGGDFVKWFESEVPGAAVTKRWAEKNVADPTGDFIVKKWDSVFNTNLEKRLAAAPERERAVFFESNDVSMDRDADVSTAFSPDEREALTRKALGETGDPLWDDKPSGFTRDELAGMSDKELVNAAYGSHTSYAGKIIEGIKSDFGKISAMPAAIQQLDDMIYQAKEEGDHRGLGKMAEFMAKQALFVPYAVAKAGLWTSTGGKVGDYETLAKAFEKEPLLTTLDGIATASGVGKGGAIALKSGMAGGAIGRAVGATSDASRLGRAARFAEETRNIAREGRVLARNPDLAKGAETRIPTSADEAADVVEDAFPLGKDAPRVFQPRGGLGSVLLTQARKNLFESTGRGGAAYRRFLGRRDAVSARALISHVANVRGDQAVIPIAEAINAGFKEGDDIGILMMADLMGVTPAEQIRHLEDVLAGRGWTRDIPDANGDVQAVFRYADEKPEGDGWTSLRPNDENEITTLKLNIEMLRKADQAAQDPAKAARVAELLDGNYADVYGPRSGKRGLVGFKGRIAPPGSLREYIETLETDNIGRLARMGNRSNPRVADLPGPLEEAARTRLGLGRRPTPLSRRTAGMEAIARTQDPKVAEILSSPRAAEIRSDLEAVIAEGAAAVTKESRSARASRGRATGDVAKIKAERKTLRAQLAKDRAAYKALKDKKSASARKIKARIDENAAKNKALGLREKKATGRLETAESTLEELAQRQEKIDAVAADIDLYVESKIRDFIEESDRPMGGSAFFPTGTKPRDAKADPDPRAATVGAMRARDLRRVHAGQFALVGDAKTIQQFGAALARNMKMPLVAYDFVVNLNRFFLNEGLVIRMSDDPEVFAQQAQTIADLNYINTLDNPSDFAVIPINKQTGFFTRDQFVRLDQRRIDQAASADAEGIGVDQATVSRIVNEALNDNALKNVRDNYDRLAGTDIVIIPQYILDRVKSEVQAASRTPNLFDKASRTWVRFALSTLPRTPIANVLGSAVLSGLGGGLGGYRKALRLFEQGDAPPELINVGIAGSTGTDLTTRAGLPIANQNALRTVGNGVRAYMDYIYSYNVIGEDLARLSVFAAYVQKQLKKNPALRAQVEKELAAARELTNDANELLAYIARGEFGPNASPEVLALRDRGLQRATDFLGGRVGLTRTTRQLTRVFPFYSWLTHILKLYLYTMPLNYPGRMLFLNGMARMGAEQQRETGMLDGFYRDAIILAEEETPGGNIVAKGLRTNIAPFSFGDLAEGEGVPGAEFVFGSMTPVISAPLNILGARLPGVAPLRNPDGSEAEGFGKEFAQAATAELERLLAPASLLQRGTAPNTSLLWTMFGGLPQIEPRGEGPSYEVLPRGIARSLPGAALETGLGAFGISRVQQPVRGPIANRRAGSLADYKARQELDARLGN